MGRRVIDGCHEAILTRLDHFCGIEPWVRAVGPVSRQPFVSLYMSLGQANRQKVKLAKMALHHLQEPRDNKIRQCKHIR